MPTIKFQVNPEYLKKYPESVTLYEGEPVALSGKEITVTRPGTVTHPPTSRTIKGATQTALKYLKEVEKNPHIDEITVKDEK